MNLTTEAKEIIAALLLIALIVTVEVVKAEDKPAPCPYVDVDQECDDPTLNGPGPTGRRR